MTVEISVETNTREAIRKLEASPFALIQAQRNALREIKDGVLQEYKRTTATWQHKPYFQVYESSTGDTHTFKVSTDDKIYKFVNSGTRAHVILPKKPGGYLRFTWGGHGSYVAKTQPGYISSREGGPTGKQVFRKGVKHPGTKAREFTRLIQELWAGKAKEVIERHVKMAMERGNNPFGR